MEKYLDFFFFFTKEAGVLTFPSPHGEDKILT